MHPIPSPLARLLDPLEGRMPVQRPPGRRAAMWAGLLLVGVLGLSGCTTPPARNGSAPVTADVGPVTAARSAEPWTVAPRAVELPSAEPGAVSEAQRSAVPPAAASATWQAFALPGKRKTVYREVQVDGRPALHAQADVSASMWRRPVQVPAVDLGRLRFSWKVPQLIEGADLTVRDGADSPVRIVLAFAGDNARLPLRDRLMFDLAETLTGERPPFATMMYVWDNRAPVDSVIQSSRSERIRKLVVESGPRHCQRWLAYERDVVADYRRLFGEEPGALIGVAVMTDSDNTESRTEAYYGRIELIGRAGQPLL